MAGHRARGARPDQRRADRLDRGRRRGAPPAARHRGRAPGGHRRARSPRPPCRSGTSSAPTGTPCCSPRPGTTQPRSACGSTAERDRPADSARPAAYTAAPGPAAPRSWSAAPWPTLGPRSRFSRTPGHRPARRTSRSAPSSPACRPRSRTCSRPARSRSAAPCCCRPGTGPARPGCRCCSTRTAARTRSGCWPPRARSTPRSGWPSRASRCWWRTAGAPRAAARTGTGRSGTTWPIRCWRTRSTALHAAAERHARPGPQPGRPSAAGRSAATWPRWPCCAARTCSTPRWRARRSPTGRCTTPTTPSATWATRPRTRAPYSTAR